MKEEKIFIILFVLLSLLVAIGPVGAQPSEVWVDDDGTPNGTDHFTSIQEGINAVCGGGTVHVAAGTYSLTDTISISNKNISLIGDGQSTTFLDGGTTYNEDGSVDVAGCGVIETAGLSDSTLISGFTIRNGYADWGGGMCNQFSSSPMVTNCMFTENTATYYGGGMCNLSSSPTVTDCTFTENTATIDGGGMCNLSSSPTVTDCTFTKNTANHVGGMCNLSSSPMVTNCMFTDNAAAVCGGMYNYDSSPTVTNCTFTENTANHGGGMYNYDSSLTVTDCTFTQNTAEYLGGGMYNESSSLSVTDCTFTDNAANHGGGMRNYDSSPTVTNCTFTNNAADDYGGGMCNYSSSPTVTNCTFTNNAADNYGGGMRNYDSSPTVTNCILWNDTAASEAEICNESGSTPLVTYSDIQGGYPTGEGNIDSDPLFVNAAAGDFSLMSGSPCIDSGTDTSAEDYGYVTEDIIGTSRPQGGVYDMGAYEYVPLSWSPSWSPVSSQPLVTSSLAQANSLWACIEPDLARCSDKEALVMVSLVQEYMEMATTIANPIAACGGLFQAIALIEEISGMV